MPQFQIQLRHSFLTQGWQSFWGPGIVWVIEKCSMVHCLSLKCSISKPMKSHKSEYLLFPGLMAKAECPECHILPVLVPQWATLLRPSLFPEVPSRATHWCLFSYEPKNFSFSPGLREYFKIFSLLWQFQHREPLECQALASTVFPSLEAQRIPLWSTAFGKTKARRITVFLGE